VFSPFRVFVVHIFLHLNGTGGFVDGFDNPGNLVVHVDVDGD
jgi:hypothetical protein